MNVSAIYNWRMPLNFLHSDVMPSCRELWTPQKRDVDHMTVMAGQPHDFVVSSVAVRTPDGRTVRVAQYGDPAGDPPGASDTVTQYAVGPLQFVEAGQDFVLGTVAHR